VGINGVCGVSQHIESRGAMPTRMYPVAGSFEEEIRRLPEKNVPGCTGSSFVFKERQQAHSGAL
jgi:hypothetical protein